MVQKDWDVRTDAELCMVRLDASGKVKKVAVCKGSFVRVGDRKLETGKDFQEINVEQ